MITLKIKNIPFKDLDITDTVEHTDFDQAETKTAALTTHSTHRSRTKVPTTLQRVVHRNPGTQETTKRVPQQKSFRFFSIIALLEVMKKAKRSVVPLKASELT